MLDKLLVRAVTYNEKLSQFVPCSIETHVCALRSVVDSVYVQYFHLILTSCHCPKYGCKA